MSEFSCECVSCFGACKREPGFIVACVLTSNDTAVCSQCKNPNAPVLAVINNPDQKWRGFNPFPRYGYLEPGLTVDWSTYK